jgi:hypothetical protein
MARTVYTPDDAEQRALWQSEEQHAEHIINDSFDSFLHGIKQALSAALFNQTGHANGCLNESATGM